MIIVGCGVVTCKAETATMQPSFSQILHCMALAKWELGRLIIQCRITAILKPCCCLVDCLSRREEVDWSNLGKIGLLQKDANVFFTNTHLNLRSSIYWAKSCA